MEKFKFSMQVSEEIQQFIDSEVEIPDELIERALSELRRLNTVNGDLVAALQEMVDVNDEPCHMDHHGFCQSHFLDDVNDGGCRVANAIEAIKKATGDAQ